MCFTRISKHVQRSVPPLYIAITIYPKTNFAKFSTSTFHFSASKMTSCIPFCTSTDAPPFISQLVLIHSFCLFCWMEALSVYSDHCRAMGLRIRGMTLVLGEMEAAGVKPYRFGGLARVSPQCTRPGSNPVGQRR